MCMCVCVYMYVYVYVYVYMYVYVYVHVHVHVHIAYMYMHMYNMYMYMYMHSPVQDSKEIRGEVHHQPVLRSRQKAYSKQWEGSSERGSSPSLRFRR